MQQSTTPKPPPQSLLRGMAVGMGNVLGFIVAAAEAGFDLLRGRWDGPQRRAAKRKGIVEKIAPYPIDD